MTCRRLSLYFSLVLAALVFCDVAQAAKKQVVFIRYRIVPSCFMTVVNGFKETMSQRGYVEGRDIEYIDVLTRSADQASVPDVLEAVATWQDSADMFITCGWVSMIAREELAKKAVPQLFVPVLESVARTMLPSVHHTPETNLSGVYLMYPPAKILRLTRLLMPDLKKYAYVYDSRIPADQVFKAAYDDIPESERYGITVHPIDLAHGVDSVLKALGDQEIEAYGGIVGVFNKHEELAAGNLPVITSLAIDVSKHELGSYVRGSQIVAGLFNPFGYIGEQAAEMTADIFEGKNTIEKTIPRPAKQMAFVNMDAAGKFNLKVPFSALEAVDVVVK